MTPADLDAIETTLREVYLAPSIADAFAALRQERDSHCVDCCCARSWDALGVTEYDGKSIPEHITALRAEVAALRQTLVAAETWIHAVPHGDNCYVCNHYEGDPGNQCNCGRESALAMIAASLDAARAAIKEGR